MKISHYTCTYTCTCTCTKCRCADKSFLFFFPTRSTWSGPPWSAAQSLLSVLLSIQSLLCEKPYHNEPGYETVSYCPRLTEYFDRQSSCGVKLASSPGSPLLFPCDFIYHSVLGKRPLPGKYPCTTFHGATVAASIQTYGILIPGKCPCGPKSRWDTTVR